MDIKGNDIADQLAKDALTLPAILLPVNLSKTEVYSIINNSIKSKWEKHWKNLDQNNHLRTIIETPKNHPSIYGKNKTEDKVITRLRLGTTKLRGEIHQIINAISPYCLNCNTGAIEDLAHIMKECPSYKQERKSLTNALEKLKIKEINIKDLLKNSENERAIHALLIKYLNSINKINEI